MNKSSRKTSKLKLELKLHLNCSLFPFFPLNSGIDSRIKCIQRPTRRCNNGDIQSSCPGGKMNSRIIKHCKLQMPWNSSCLQINRMLLRTENSTPQVNFLSSKEVSARSWT